MSIAAVMDAVQLNDRDYRTMPISVSQTEDGRTQPVVVAQLVVVALYSLRVSMHCLQPITDLVSITRRVTILFVRFRTYAHTADHLANVAHDQTSFHSACSMSYL